MNGTIGPRQDLELDLDNFSRVLDMNLDLRLDLMEFTGRLIGFPFVNGFYFEIVFFCLVYLLCLDSLRPKGECGIRFGLVVRWRSGVYSPISLRLRASGR